MYTRAEAKYYSSLDPRDPDYLDLEEEHEEEHEELEEEHDEWGDEEASDYIMTEPEKRGAL